jgi:hypothetical protein
MNRIQVDSLGAVKAEALRSLEEVFRESYRLQIADNYGIWHPSRVKCSRRKGTPKFGHMILWRDPITEESSEIVWVPSSFLCPVVSALYSRLKELRARQNVIEFPAQLQESA